MVDLNSTILIITLNADNQKYNQDEEIVAH